MEFGWILQKMHLPTAGYLFGISIWDDNFTTSETHFVCRKLFHPLQDGGEMDKSALGIIRQFSLTNGRIGLNRFDSIEPGSTIGSNQVKIGLNRFGWQNGKSG